MLNDFHGGACDGYLSRLSTTQKILRARDFLPSIFKYCINEVKKCHPCQVFKRNMHSHLSLLHSIITVGPFTKWGIEFMDCKPASAGGHHHIIVAVDYFMKWEEVIPMIKSNGEIAMHFVFNQIITLVDILKELVTNHGRHFKNRMMEELASNLGNK